MKLSFNSISRFISSFHAVLFFTGFLLFTTVFYGTSFDGRETSSLTISYRLFTLIVALLVIPFNLKLPHLNTQSKLFIFLWICYLFRVIYDLFIRSDSSLILPHNQLVLLHDVVVTCFIPMIVLFLSYKNLNWEAIFYAIMVVLTFCVLMALLSDAKDYTQRGILNIAQNTHVLGFYSAALILAGLTGIRASQNHSKIKITLFIIVVFIGAMGLGTSASRGPLVGLLLSIFLYPLFKHTFKTGLVLVGIVFILFLFQDYFLNLIYGIFPVFVERFLLPGPEEGGITGREHIFKDAILQIKDNPLLGNWHRLYAENGLGNTAHNIILSTFMSLGIFIGSIIVYLYLYFIRLSVKLISLNSIYSYIGFLVLLCIGMSLTTGGDLIYKDNFNFAFAAILIVASNKALVEYKVLNQSNYMPHLHAILGKKVKVHSGVRVTDSM